ncbi:MAG: ribosome-associated translation inhibitor RaiA [Moraxella sp.]|nr:ribosome-associated translation inhibitor RaiA [Moraxella sp.]
MNLSITGHHITVTEALEQTVKEKLAKPLRHFDQIQSIQVILSRDHHHSEAVHAGAKAYHAEAILRVSGQEMFVKATEDDMYKAIGEMADMLTRQVRKHKTRLERRHQGDKRADLMALAAEG